VPALAVDSNVNGIALPFAGKIVFPATEDDWFDCEQQFVHEVGGQQ
jgi:hypothetical protein